MTRDEIINKMRDNLDKLEKNKISQFNASTMLNYLKTLLKELDNDDLPEPQTKGKILHD